MDPNKTAPRKANEPENLTMHESWDSYNSFLLTGTPQRFTKFLLRYELFKGIVDKPGDIVEAGVFKGAGVLYWAKLIEIFNPLSLRRVIGFDTFDGYPEATIESYEQPVAAEFLADANYNSDSPEKIMEIAASQGLENRIELIKGDATFTIKDYVEKNTGFRVALLNSDLDSYHPTAAALEHLYPLVVPGGVIAFDEYGERQWGESQAADEFFKDKHVMYHSMPWAYSPTAYVVKEP